MLKVFWGYYDGELYSADSWFKNQLDEQYYVTDFSKKAVLDIDDSEIVSENLVVSPYLGAIPPEKLSSGVKGIIVMKYTDKVVNLVSMGDNCLMYVMDIAMEKDLTVSSSRLVNPYKYGYSGDIFILNDETIVSDFDGFVSSYLKYRGNFR